MSLLPTLSVVIPNYNHGHYLEACLTSITTQSLKPAKVIVVDDASTDDSVQIVERYSRRDRSVVLMRNDRNRGPTFSTNRGLRAASGTYVYPSSADDRALPGLFEKSVALLQAHPQAAFCCSDAVFVQSSTGRRQRHLTALTTSSGYVAPVDFVRQLGAKRTQIVGITTIIRRSSLESVGWYPESLRWHNDWFLMLVLAMRHGLCYISEELAESHVHSGSFSDPGEKSAAQLRSEVLRILALLDTPAFADVRDAFRSSGALAPLAGVGLAVLQAPRFWRHFASPRVAGALRTELLRELARVTPPVLKRTYRRFRPAI